MSQLYQVLVCTLKNMVRDRNITEESSCPLYLHPYNRCAILGRKYKVFSVTIISVLGPFFPLTSWFLFSSYCCWVNENIFKPSTLTLSAKGTFLNVFPFPLKLQHLKSVSSPILPANSLPWINLKFSREKGRMTGLSAWDCTSWEYFLGESSHWANFASCLTGETNLVSGLCGLC